MRAERVIKYLASVETATAPEKLAEVLGISVRTLANDVNEINFFGQSKGFRVERVRGKGYKLLVEDEERFAKYKASWEATDLFDASNTCARLGAMELSLLLATDYVTMSQLAEMLGVSVSTVKKDMKAINAFFEGYQLGIHSKPHYGLTLVGEESQRRKAIIDLARSQSNTVVLTTDYSTFQKRFKKDELRHFLEAKCRELRLKVNDMVFENILLHVELLLFRLFQENTLAEVPAGEEGSGEPVYEALVAGIGDYFWQEYGVKLPEAEAKYLRQQLQGKIVVLSQEGERQDLAVQIEATLKEIDLRHGTAFHGDVELCNSILLHVLPLLQRLYHGHQLENPLIEDIYRKYANVFNIAYEFIHRINENYTRQISKDEIGYVAIYFAASLEKQNNAELKKYRDIAVICATGGGASYLLKIKLEKIFDNARVSTFSKNELNQVDGSFDLVISTVPIDESLLSVPVVYTKNLLSEKEVKQIEKDLILLRDTKAQARNVNAVILELFSAGHFHKVLATDYLSLLKERAEALEAEGVAEAGYAQSVLEREQLLPTIYDKGIAGPHPMEPASLRDCIDVILVQSPMVYEQKKVRLIFLINIGTGHLLLHKEISRLMIQMMEDPALDYRLKQMNSFEDFYAYVKELLI